MAGLADDDFTADSGCAGWLVRDLVCHLIIDAQDVLITLVTPADTAPTRNAVSYWSIAEAPPDDEMFDGLVVRLAAAYQEPRLLKFHFDDVGAAAGRAAALADPEQPVSTQDFVLTTDDYLSAYVLEWTLHHLDLTAHLPDVPGPPPESLARARELLEAVAGAAFPTVWTDEQVLLIGTGRSAPTAQQTAELGALAGRLPLLLG